MLRNPRDNFQIEVSVGTLGSNHKLNASRSIYKLIIEKKLGSYNQGGQSSVLEQLANPFKLLSIARMLPFLGREVAAQGIM